MTPASVTPIKRNVKTANAKKLAARKPVSKPNGKAQRRTAKPKIEQDVSDDDNVEPTASSTDQSSDGDDDSEDAFNPDSSATEEEVIGDEEESDIDSDFLDEEKQDHGKKRAKRKSGAGAGGGSAKKARTSTGQGNQAAHDDEDEDANLSDAELEEGQTVAGRIYPAPTTGQGKLARFSWLPRSSLSATWQNIYEHIELPEEPTDP